MQLVIEFSADRCPLLLLLKHNMQLLPSIDSWLACQVSAHFIKQRFDTAELHLHSLKVKDRRVNNWIELISSTKTAIEWIKTCQNNPNWIIKSAQLRQSKHYLSQRSAREGYCLVNTERGGYVNFSVGDDRHTGLAGEYCTLVANGSQFGQYYTCANILIFSGNNLDELKTTIQDLKIFKSWVPFAPLCHGDNYSPMLFFFFFLLRFFWLFE